MNIGELAEKTQLNAKMIRRYEELGIIPKASRSLSGYRQYGDKDVNVLIFVKRARALGFSMKDIKQLLSLWRNKTRSSAQVKSIAMKHQQELTQKLTEIQAMLKTINHLVHNCHGDDRPDCPIIEELNKP
ncbi:MAG: Cu(I)-responsive transcriptional regulator [Proteobacteria bacterium]|jgi:Cu(I)-responsive transcriptional regulator|nr:Cu(I)-responsive transcriptional regulator [Pseudomonadota bacterium]